MKNRYRYTDYVCTHTNGKPISPNYLSKHFHAIVKDVFKKVRLHDLRHSAATNLLEIQVRIANKKAVPKTDTAFIIYIFKK